MGANDTSTIENALFTPELNHQLHHMVSYLIVFKTLKTRGTAPNQHVICLSDKLVSRPPHLAPVPDSLCGAPFQRVLLPFQVLLADEGVASLPTAGPVTEEKLLLAEGLSPLLPVPSIKEEDVQPGARA